MKTKTQSSLFEPLKKDHFQLNNRIVMAPMTRSRAIGSVPNDLMVKYYSQRSSAGLIITEGTSPSPNGLGYARIPGIFNREQTEAWGKITEAVHQQGGKIVLQLMHTGRVAHPENLPDGGKVLAPTAVRADVPMWTDASGMQPLPVPEAMSEEDLENVVREFTDAAQNAVAAGFDGVELHGANGYLLEQFLNPKVNTRTDRYGGSNDQRLRFVLEVVDSVIGTVGKEKTAIRLSPYNTFNDMPAYDETFETYAKLIKALNDREILYLHLVENAARDHEKGKELLSSIRENFDNILIVNGGYDKDKADQVLSEKRVDLVSFGTPFIANPDLPDRIRHNLPLADPDRDTFYSAEKKGYTDYPAFHN